MAIKIRILSLLLLTVFVFSACSGKTDATPPAAAGTTETETTENVTEPNETQEQEMKISIKVNGTAFTATLENNTAAKELYEIIRTQGLTVKMSDYSGFEKVGALGHTLTSDDKQTTTKAGDIVLYQSNQIVMFYGSNSWRYTRLGTIDNISGWAKALGSEEITAEFSAL